MPFHWLMLLQIQWYKDYNLVRDSLSSNSQNIMQFKKKAYFYIQRVLVCLLQLAVPEVGRRLLIICFPQSVCLAVAFLSTWWPLVCYLTCNILPVGEIWGSHSAAMKTTCCMLGWDIMYIPVICGTEQAGVYKIVMYQKGGILYVAFRFSSTYVCCVLHSTFESYFI